MWAQTRDRAAAMLAHVVVSIGKLDAIPTDRRCDRTWSWHHHRRRRPVLGSSEARQNNALWTRVLLAMVDLFVRRTQWVVLSAADVHPWCGASRAGPGRGVDGADGAIQPLLTVMSQLLTQRAFGLWLEPRPERGWLPGGAPSALPMGALQARVLSTSERGHAEHHLGNPTCAMRWFSCEGWRQRMRHRPRPLVTMFPTVSPRT